MYGKDQDFLDSGKCKPLQVVRQDDLQPDVHQQLETCREFWQKCEFTWWTTASGIHAYATHFSFLLQVIRKVESSSSIDHKAIMAYWGIPSPSQWTLKCPDSEHVSTDRTRSGLKHYQVVFTTIWLQVRQINEQ